MIKSPKWCKDAEPTVHGWVHPVSGELLKSQKFTAEQVAEWHGPSAPEPTPVEEDLESEE